MTEAEAVLQAHRLWREQKLTGELVFNYRHGIVKHIRHGHIDFVDGDGSARRADGKNSPVCPTCGQPMSTRDKGQMWGCEPCGIKRTAAQLAETAP